MPHRTIDPALRPKLSPFWIVGGLLAVVVVLLVTMVSVASLRPVPPLQVPGASVVTLPDGKRLFVNVTYGKDHNWTAQLAREGSMHRLLSPTQEVSSYMNTHGEQYMIWLAGADPTTGEPLDFTWWAYASVVDQYGKEIRDRDCRRVYHETVSMGYGTSMIDADRPMEPLDAPEADTIIACSTLPLFHTNKPQFTLRLHDINGQIAAQVVVPTRHARPARPWSPGSLPATRHDGDLTVTLTGIATQRRAADDDSDRGPGWRVTPSYQVQWKGEPSDEWYAIMEVFDSLGNRDPTNWVELSDRVPAWKLRLRLARNEEARFAEHEMWQAAMIPLPKPGEFQPIAAKGVANGGQFTLIGVGGRGPTSYRLNDIASNSSGSSSSSSSIRLADGTGEQYSIKVRTDEGKADIETSGPHLTLAIPALDSSDLIVRVVDDQGRTVPVRWKQFADLAIVMLGITGDVKAIQPTIIVSGHRHAEFFIAPPVAEETTPSP